MPPRVTKQKPAGTPPAVGSVLGRAAPIGFTDDEGIKVLLYGRSGTGKTTLWATFPDPILCVVCSGGNKPGELRSINTPANRDRILAVTLGRSDELREIISDPAVGNFKTLVLDHASGLQDLTLKEVLGLDELPAQRSWGLASQQQYGQSTLMCKELLRGLLGFDGNVVIIAQEREFNVESGSELITPTVGAGLTPSLTGWLNTAVDYICQTFIRQKEEVKETAVGNKVMKTKVAVPGVEYCLRTGPHAVYQTKFRVPRGSGDLPEVIVNPDYSKIMGLINGSRK